MAHHVSIVVAGTDIAGHMQQIEYSEKYCDGVYEYRHVILPKELAKAIVPEKQAKILAEAEWRSLGVQQSRGWAHYAVHRPEPHILLFRRELGTDPVSGKVDPKLREAAVAEYQRENGHMDRDAAVTGGAGAIAVGGRR